MTPSQRHHLLELARWSIEHGIQSGRKLRHQETDAELCYPAATFVTLNLNGELRGCIGSLAAHRNLTDDVVENAYSAAFRDPRFTPVTARELAQLEIHISILSPTEPLQFQNEADLLQQLRPGIDGLVLEAGHHRGTFLPQVWEQLPEPVDFLAHLKRKAGLPMSYWSPTLRVERYTVESIP